MSSTINIKIKAAIEGTKEVQKLEKELTALGKIDAFKKLKKDIQDSKTAWVEAQAEVVKLAKEIKSADKPTKDLSNRFKAAKNEAAKLKTAFQQKQQALHKLRGSLKEAGIDTGKLSVEQKKLQQAIAGTREEISKAAKINAAKGLLDVKPYQQVEKEIKDLEDAYDRLKKSGTLSARELAQAKKNLKRRVAELRREVDKYGNSLSKAKKMASGLKAVLTVATFAVVGAAIAGMTKSLFEAGVKMQSLEAAYKAIFNASRQARQEFEFLRKSADELGLEFYSTAEAYKGIAAAAKGTSLEGEGVRKVFLSMSEASTALGLSAEKTDRIFTALGQMMSKGKVSAEELRQQIGEHFPPAFNLAAESMEMTTEEFDKLMSEGKIFSEDFLPRFAKLVHEKFGKAAKNAAENAQQSFNRLVTAWTDLKTKMAESEFLDSTTQAINEMTEALKNPDVISSLQSIGKLLGDIISLTGKAALGISTLISRQKQFSLGMEMANKGVIDSVKFAQASFEERQKMIDAAFEKTGYITEEFAEKLDKNVKQKFKEISQETGVTIESMQDLKRAVQIGALSFDEASGAWVSAEKKKQEALQDTVNAARDAARNISVSQDKIVKLMNQSSINMIERIKEDAKQRVITESDAVKQIIEINKNLLETSLTYAKEQLERVKELYGEDSRAYAITAQKVETETKELKDYKIQAAKDVTAALKSELGKQLDAEKKLNAEIKTLKDKYVTDQESREDDIRAIRQKSMTDAEKQADLEKQAKEKIGKATEALKKKEFDRAEDLAKQAKSIASGLEDEKSAIDLVGKAWDVVADSTKEQEKEKQSELDKTIKKIGDLKSEIDTIEKNIELEIKADMDKAKSDIKALKGELDDIQGKPVVVNARVEMSGDTSPERLKKIMAEIDDKSIVITTESKPANNDPRNTPEKTKELIAEIGDKSITMTTEAKAVDERSTPERLKELIEEIGDKSITMRTESDPKNGRDTPEGLKAAMDEVKDKSVTLSTDTGASQSKLNNIKATLDGIKSKTITITTIHKTVEAKQAGGPVGLARGGRLPGYGGGDKIKALLEAGEFVVRKEAVAKYGVGLLSALNGMKLNLPDMQGVVKARIGGLISNLSIPEIPVQRFAAGGMATASGQGTSETLVVRFQAGDVEAPVKITDPDSRMAIKRMAKEMSRMRMTYAR